MTEWESPLTGIIFVGPNIEDAFLIGGATKSPNFDQQYNHAFFVSLSDEFTSLDLASYVDVKQYTDIFTIVPGLMNAPSETLT